MLIIAGTRGKERERKQQQNKTKKQNEKQKQNAITTKTFELKTGTRDRDKIIGRQKVSAICKSSWWGREEGRGGGGCTGKDETELPGSGDSSGVERQTLDRKVAGSSPGRSGGRMFFSRVNLHC